MNARRALTATFGLASVLCFVLAGVAGLQESRRADDPALALGWIATAGLTAAGALAIYLRGLREDHRPGRPGAVVFGAAALWSAVFAWIFLERGRTVPGWVLFLFAGGAAALSFRSWWSVRDG